MKKQFLFCYIYLVSIFRGTIQNVFKFLIVAGFIIIGSVSLLVYLIFSIYRFILFLVPYPIKSDTR